MYCNDRGAMYDLHRAHSMNSAETWQCVMHSARSVCKQHYVSLLQPSACSGTDELRPNRGWSHIDIPGELNQQECKHGDKDISCNTCW